MRIMQVMAGADRGGAETAFVDMCLAMHERGITQIVVTRANDLRVPRLRSAGLRVICMPFGGALDFYTPWRISRIAREWKPDIVQTWMARAASKVPRGNYKVVARLGGYYKLKNFVTTDYFISITPDIRAYLIQSGIAPDHVRHINNFAETEPVTEILSKRDLQSPQDCVAVLALSRLHHSKALDILIRAVEPLPNVHVWLAGEGPLRQELEELAAGLPGVGGRIHFLGWRSDRAALLQACDICVFPSRYEPFGTVFVQAWANDTPVICSRADGPRQFVRDGKDGILFEIDDVAGLSAAIQRIAADKDLRGRLIENGKRRYLEEFTREKAVQAYLDFYEEILQR